MKVEPAVWVGLFLLFALRLRSVIRSAGPLLRSSFASSRPPGVPSSSSAAWTSADGCANGGRLGKIRPNVVGLVATVALLAACGAKAAVRPPDIATAPAPTPARFRNPRRL